jgi:hypothetical protein
VGLLEDLGLRRPRDMSNRIGGRLPPKDLGELRFEEWLYILDLSEHQEQEGDKIKARALAERQYREGKGKQRIGGADCQEDQLSPSVQKALKGYIRVAFYADSPKGKSRAKARGKQLSDEYEGELFVRVRRVYCKDSRQWGWSVWVKRTGMREETYSVFGMKDGVRTVSQQTRMVSVMAPRKEAAGGFGSSTVRSWTVYRSAAKKKVSCPKCDAPKDFPCVNDRGIEEGIYEENGKPMTAKQAQKYKAGRGLVKEVRVRRTNPHRERVDKYLKEKEGLVENPLTAGEGDFIKDEERRPPTNSEREQWMLRNYNEKQLERYEDLEDEGTPSVGDMERLLNKKQRVKYDAWADFGQPIEKEE